MATWDEVQRNPTLYPQALSPSDGVQLRWHDDADQEHSSQVFCISAFGMLRQLPVRDRVLRELLERSEPPPGDDPTWTVDLEVEMPELLSEHGPGQPSSIDALLMNRRAVVCLESKFLSDAAAGFGRCKQPKKQCAGYYGPGSDLKTKTNAWCRLEVWDGDRSPRAYWALGRDYFLDSVFAEQADGETCPFDGPNYQLMRNFLFAAALARQEKLESFGVIAIAPAKKSGKLERQVESFRTAVLQPAFGSCVRLVTYERLIELLRQSGDGCATSLASFLAGRIAALIH